jgi:predicted nuclease of restriction endonuclease-like (RecB) superfamily
MIDKNYQSVVEELKSEIRKARLHATIAVNSELLNIYYQIGKTILKQQTENGWGSKVIDRLSNDLRAEFPDMKGFSVRNLKYMRKFAETYSNFAIVQVTLAQLTWYHHLTLLDKVKDSEERLYYIHETAQQGWSRDVMVNQIESGYWLRKGKITSNFDRTLPNQDSDLVRQAFKDPYRFDFLTLSDNYKERDLENGLVEHITKFLLELG